MSSKNGVTRYARGVAHIPVYFAGGKVCCANCLVFCRYEEAFRRYTCRATGEQILLPFSETGAQCPITLETEESVCH